MLLGLQNVTFEFGARTIVEDATWHIQPNERIALIGYNGTGKSTLLKVLTRQYLPNKGTVEQGKETTIGFLHQDLLSFDTNDSILQVAMSAFERVLQLEKEIDTAGQKEQLLKDLDYQKGFLISVEKKLSNERFVQNAKPEIVEVEKKKKADAEAKIKAIEESLALL